VLAGFGAQVDGVERLGQGDILRYVPPFVDGVGALFATVARGKRSLALDFRSPGAGELLKRLIGQYDVLVEGFKPGVLEAMGLSPAQLHALYPGLVIARLSGFGQTGPMANKPGHDINYVGYTGMLSMMPEVDQGLAFPPVQIADVSGGLLAATAIAAALVKRERTGKGEVLDISLTEAALLFTSFAVATATGQGHQPAPGSETLTGGLPVYGTYRCSDGKWITVGALEPKFQALLMEETKTLGRRELQEVFATKTRDEWVERLSAACVGPVLSFHEAAQCSLLQERGVLTRLSQTTLVQPPLCDRSLGAVATVGEHSRTILQESGWSEQDVDELLSRGWISEAHA